jgi:antitoxin component of MazEF toxin-antitoxin module
MLLIKRKMGLDGKIAIGEVLKMAKIQPGDWVEIKPVNNKITIKTVKKTKPKGAVKAAAGILSDRNDLIDEMLRIREDEHDRSGTSIQ